jgi:hypothetical protein
MLGHGTKQPFLKTISIFPLTVDPYCCRRVEIIADHRDDAAKIF